MDRMLERLAFFLKNWMIPKFCKGDKVKLDFAGSITCYSVHSYYVNAFGSITYVLLDGHGHCSHAMEMYLDKCQQNGIQNN